MKILTPLILVALAIAGFILYTNPHYAHIKELQATAAEYEFALTQINEAEAQFDQKLSTYNSIDSADLDKLQKMLPDSIDNIRLLKDLNDIAQGYGTSIKNIQVQPLTVSDSSGQGASNSIPFGSLGVSFSVSTTYDVFIEFLKDLERSLRLVDLSVTSFQSVDTSIYTFQVSFRTYWLKQ